MACFQIKLFYKILGSMPLSWNVYKQCLKIKVSNFSLSDSKIEANTIVDLCRVKAYIFCNNCMRTKFYPLQTKAFF